MTSRLPSAIHFMLDAFIIALVLVFADTQGALSVAWIWLLLAWLVSVSSYLLFSRYSYQLVGGIGLSTVATVSMWAMGMSLWLATILGMLSVYLLHARYSVRYKEFNYGHYFLMKFTVVFSICWTLVLLNPNQQTSRLLFSIVPVAILFYVGAQLLYSYLHTRQTGAKFSQVASVFGLLVSIPSVVAISIFYIADDVRRLAGWAVGGMIRVVFWPLALLLEQVNEFLAGLSTEEEMQETLEVLGPDEETGQRETMVSETMPSDFPIEILLGIVMVISAVVLIIWLRKIKPDSETPVPKSTIRMKRHDHLSTELFVSTAKESPASRDLHQIREVFRSLELMAKEQKLERQSHETVREWIARMDWDVSASFYKTYDRVRYGDKQLPESQASNFIAEIEKIKNHYLNKNV
ncbi:hypothetical protein ACQKDD_05980 [Planococcus kocurii]|uniref:hypothetical protein n=1 Tax=Planococcus TaxID=1372 RepID=UPI0011EEE22E|nr:hypothetical protein [Planococcus sp. ANT_H30]KAA0958490.1 hypothetical protein FQ085_01855 [Planococcus sp. ANT_H30]